MGRDWLRLAGLILYSAPAACVWAGGSGLNVAVVVNQASTNSVQLGNYYCEQRQVPPQNLLRTSWAGENIAWQRSDFQSVILNPLLAMLAARQLTNQIDYVLLCMDFPYRVTDTTGANSTTTPLFYGFVPDGAAPGPGAPASCSLPSASFNAYAGSELSFRSVAPGTSRTNFLAVMLTCSNLAQAKLVIDRAVAGDSSFFTQTVYLGKSQDTARNIRYPQFDNTVFNTRLRWNYSVQRTNVNSANYLGYIGGYENGYQGIVPINNYAPGALADQLTSFSGQLYEQSDHTTALQYVLAGAAGSYGTVIEPCAYVAKFPSPQVFFYQARGFSMAECYYQSVTNPYQGILLGDPLAAPFALPAVGLWNNLPSNALLRGTTNLSLQFTAADAQHPVQQVDLFVDGTFAQTVTNIPPSAGNVLSVTLNGYPTNYTVPANATIPSVVATLTARLNRTAYINATRIQAFAHGDRIELQSTDSTMAGSQISASVGSSAGTATALTTFLSASDSSFLDTVADGIRGCVITGGSPAIGDYLQLSITKTNGAAVAVAITNDISGNTLPNLAQGLVNMVNTNADLQGSDGVAAEDFIPYDPSNGRAYPRFNLRALSPGWNASQLQASLSGSATFSFLPSGTQHLDSNVTDLEPRNHLYVTAGLTNLPLTFAFNTATQADGFHELTAVVYEGSHVRTQQRVPRTVRIQNTTLSATFTVLYGGSNTLVGATLQFSVAANTNNIAKIELFSTGGSLGSVANQSTAGFSVPGTRLDLGLHPFYAVATANNGQRYRTETKWIRLVSTEAPFTVAATSPPPVLSWPATVGRSYDILTATNLADPFLLNATLAPSNSPAVWADTNPPAPQRFYRVRTAD